MNNLLVVGIGVAVLLIGGLFITDTLPTVVNPFSEMNRQDTNTNTGSDSRGVVEQEFHSSGLTTNTAVRSIDLSIVLGGGPAKDGIPALMNPEFVSVDQAPRTVTDDMRGILISNNGVTKFYPYNILVWHEIVNDEVGGEPMVVTFCPLCGSAIVFDAQVDGEKTTFGVSGKLYESNLLMYDHKTESLWSQALGEAVVGDRTGMTLEHKPFQLLSFAEVKEKYPNVQILSDNTGHRRDYTLYPYGSYESDDQVLFPVSVSDQRFSAKEIMYAATVDGTNLALPFNDLKEAGEAILEVAGETIRAEAVDGEVWVYREDGTLVPGYHIMWFSWATHYSENGVVWKP